MFSLHSLSLSLSLRMNLVITIDLYLAQLQRILSATTTQCINKGQSGVRVCVRVSDGVSSTRAMNEQSSASDVDM